MKKLKHNYGMTIAELLIVVAIIGVLSGVAFIAVDRYQRSMGQLERDGIAKEIFVAAQNHLTAAYGEGYLGANASGTEEATGSGIFYFVYPENGFTSNGSSILDQMLPFGSIDETVRAGGSYIVRYQKEAGLVLDVFYCSRNASPTRFNHSLTSGNYTEAIGMKGDDQKPARRNCFGGAILGWYGGDEAAELAKIELAAPTIEIRNAETLSVTVKDASENYGKSASIRLLIKGELSGKEHYIDVSADLLGKEIVLDDITVSDRHFRVRSFDDMTHDIMQDDNGFIPGENLLIRAVAYSNSELSNLAYSAEKTTNSLYADGSTATTAYISNIRHLENLDKTVSKQDENDSDSDGKLNIAKAVQIRDLNWTTDDSEYWINNTVTDTGKELTGKGKYYPVSPDYAITYDGQGNSVMNLDIDFTGPAGMFGTLSNSNEIKNVIVRNNLEDDSALEIKGSGSAGGLVGSMTGGRITNCAAAVYVSGANAGGLIGSASNVAVTDSYAGGHTENGKYLTTESGEARVNVIATGSSGGLIGSMTGGSAENCYSTCSVRGTAAGGFAGTASGTISNSYCTGLVLGPGDVTHSSTVKAFVGSDNGVTASGCWYESAVNAIHYGARKAELKTANSQDADLVVEDLAAGCANAFPFDKDRPNGSGGIITAFQAYNEFLGTGFEPDEAKPYDAFLKNHYQKTGATDKTDYPLKTIQQLDNSAPDFLAVHYGDWPAPEILVVNPAA